MESTIMEVTPEMAREWLTVNMDNNRRISGKAVEKYAADMKAGRWELNGEAICFNESGKLVNGQHRLRAVIKADVPVKMYVTVGIPNSSTIYDVQKRRTVDNFLQMDGINANSRHIGTANALLDKVLSRVSVGETKRFVGDEFANLDRAVALSAKRFNNMRILQRAPIAAAAWVFIKNGYDPNMIDRFFTIATSGFYNNENETAAIMFRNYILNESAMMRGSYRQYRNMEFTVCCRAFMDFVAMKPRKKPYNAKDLENYDILTGSPAEAFLKRYGEAETVPVQEDEQPVTTLNYRDQQAGEILRIARKGAGMTLRDMSEAIGYDPSIINAWEVGKYHMADLQRKAICDYFHRDIFAEAARA